MKKTALFSTKSPGNPFSIPKAGERRRVRGMHLTGWLFCGLCWLGWPLWGGCWGEGQRCDSDKDCPAAEFKCLEGRCQRCSQASGCLTSQEREGEPPPKESEPPYPRGPYGKKSGQILAPLVLPDCDDHLYRTSSLYKSKTKLLLLSVHKGWCEPCMEQGEKLESFYQKYKEKGFVIWNVLLEDLYPGSDRVPAAFCKALQKQHHATYPLLKDPAAKILGPYTEGGATPLNMLISTQDMKIIYKKTGPTPRLGEIVSSFLSP